MAQHLSARVAPAWGELCEDFLRLLERSRDNLHEVSGALLHIVDLYAATDKAAAEQLRKQQDFYRNQDLLARTSHR